MINKKTNENGEFKMRLCSLYSGSSGNCIYAGSSDSHLLIDVGVSMKKVVAALTEIDVKPEELNGIVITHEHSDHIGGLGVFLRKYGIPVYGTRATLEAVLNYRSLGKVDTGLFHPIQPEESFLIKNLYVKAVSTWHDAADPVCYTVSDGEKKISVATDMGDYDEHIVNGLSGSDALLIEANHDIRMLEVGPYPFPLKQRILSRYGHLSNERGGQLVRELLNDHIKGIYLGHLSKENNYPDLAFEAVKGELYGNPYSNDYRDFNIMVANRDCCSKPIEI